MSAERKYFSIKSDMNPELRLRGQLFDQPRAVLELRIKLGQEYPSDMSDFGRTVITPITELPKQ